MSDNDIFLIEKSWIDPLENNTSRTWGFTLFAWTHCELIAKAHCEAKGFWTERDCWGVGYLKNKQLPKFRYTRVRQL